MEVFTKEIAQAFGVRDRINGHDAEDRHITLDRFRSRYGRPLKRLQRAYMDGYYEADYYVRFMWGVSRYAAKWSSCVRSLRAVSCPRIAQNETAFRAVKLEGGMSKNKAAKDGQVRRGCQDVFVTTAGNLARTK